MDEELKTDENDEYTLNTNLPGSTENPIWLRDLTVIGYRPISWYNRNITLPWNRAVNTFIKEDPIFGLRRIGNVSTVLSRNPNALENWQVFENAAQAVNILGGGIPEKLSPSQDIGLLIDGYENYKWNQLSDVEKLNMSLWLTLSPEEKEARKKELVPERYLNDLYLPSPHNFMESWFGNSGIVTDRFALEHPYLALGTNLLGDIGGYSLLGRSRITSSFKGPNEVYHTDKGNSTGFTGNGAYIRDGYLHPGLTRLEGQSNYIWWNEGEPFSPGFSFKKPATRIIVADKDMVPGLIRVRDLNYRIGQWNPAVKKSFVRNSEMVSSEPMPMLNANVYRRIPRTNLWFRTSTSGPFGRYWLLDFVKNPYFGSWSLNAPRSVLYSKQKVGYTNYPDTYFGEFPNSTFLYNTPPPHLRFGEFVGAGDEATVFRDASDLSKVLKISTSAGAANKLSTLSQLTVAPMMLRNKLPSSVKITPVGYGYSPGYKGYFPVFQQDFTSGILPETTFNFEILYMPRIAELLRKSGWLMLGSEFTNGLFSAYDFLPQNVSELNGVFRFVDIPVVKVAK